MRPKCYRCGGTELEDGSLRSYNDVGFRPDAVRDMETLEVHVLATMCRQCGAVELSGNVSELERLLK